MCRIADTVGSQSRIQGAELQPSECLPVWTSGVEVRKRPPRLLSDLLRLFCQDRLFFLHQVRFFILSLII